MFPHTLCLTLEDKNAPLSLGTRFTFMPLFYDCWLHSNSLILRKAGALHINPVPKHYHPLFSCKVSEGNYFCLLKEAISLASLF